MLIGRLNVSSVELETYEFAQDLSNSSGGMMKQKSLSVIVFLVPFSLLAQSPDRAALEMLYHSTNGPSWINAKGWLTMTIGETKYSSMS